MPQRITVTALPGNPSGEVPRDQARKNGKMPESRIADRLQYPPCFPRRRLKVRLRPAEVESARQVHSLKGTLEISSDVDAIVDNRYATQGKQHCVG